ncbi:hypothetical protein CVT24_008490 [Panaeolus cyanescens]|uniref:Uncharacterized protein n=1 Tax=Panaeolus cyanescens TaxID=181874 RepID=A0A409YJG8_9AGAR|nr:hypothetical protein CVT24_008490 [Panaeolus cyanescens]
MCKPQRLSKFHTPKFTLITISSPRSISHSIVSFVLNKDDIHASFSLSSLASNITTGSENMASLAIFCLSLDPQRFQTPALLVSFSHLLSFHCIYALFHRSPAAFHRGHYIVINTVKSTPPTADLCGCIVASRTKADLIFDENEEKGFSLERALVWEG